MAFEGNGHIGGVVYVDKQIMGLWWLGGRGAREMEMGAGAVAWTRPASGLFDENCKVDENAMGCLHIKMGGGNNCW